MQELNEQFRRNFLELLTKQIKAYFICECFISVLHMISNIFFYFYRFHDKVAPIFPYQRGHTEISYIRLI